MLIILHKLWMSVKGEKGKRLKGRISGCALGNRKIAGTGGMVEP
jgi:hypothetical protein